MIKAILYCSFFVLFSINTFSQTIHILDSFTQEALAGVTVKNLSSGEQLFSNYKGHLELTNLNDSLQFSFFGYETLTSIPNDTLILLKPLPFEIEQVVVSANRSKQKRSDVPLSITLLSSQKIEETNALTSSDLINKAHGVYMVDLGNEQHSMSIRQPMSYKSLYLYLEDGLPIRTSGIFNHNALLEINLSGIKNIEIIRGPSSSIYGSDAIGGAINFITQKPSAVKRAELSYSQNTLNLRRYDLILSNTEKSGFSWIINGSYGEKKNGYRDHSDYEKLALNSNFSYPINDKLKWSTNLSYINYRSDASGDLDSIQFYAKTFTSAQRFTERAVESLRFKSNLKYKKDEHSETNLTAFYRNNSIYQNPHYRIKDDYSSWKNPNGNKNLAHSEINENAFESYGLLLRNSQKFSELNLNINSGFNLDYSPSSLLANYISVHKTNSGVYSSYTKSDSLLSNYSTDITNAGAYIQLDFKPSENLTLSGGLRADLFTYLYKNNLDTSAYSAASDSNEGFNSFAPKLGFVFSPYNKLSVYANYSRGFSPPQVSELYRGVTVPYLEPSVFNNYESGIRSSFLDFLFFDIAVYRLNGLNEIVQVINQDGERVNKNASETSHNGVEYSFDIILSKSIHAAIGGSYSKHYFKEFNDGINHYVNTEMPLAPRTVSNCEIELSPRFIKDFCISAEWQHLGDYFMDINRFNIYEGFDVYNLRLKYSWKNYKIFFGVMNVNDAHYATIARKSKWGSSYSPANPRNYQLGVKLNLH